MTGYKIVNLKILAEEIGEEQTKEFLSNFSCPQNLDVENFLKRKAIDFAKQGLSQTHLVLASYKRNPVLVGYFCLASKYIAVQSDSVSKTLRKRISKFAIWDPTAKVYCLSAPLIAQLGKNYTNGYNKLIKGDELLKMACDKVSKIQLELGGRFVYLECEDKPQLTQFYAANGFCEFDHRKLEKDETELTGDYLVQMIKYIH